GHSLSNGHVAKWAIRHGVNLTLNTDAHAPSDLITAGFGRKVLAAAGIDEPQVNHIFQHAESLVERAIRRE
ncbi:MAG TPA: PHP domain-containing protein, partial [Dissulfurispiraceae bacterium]|nr:PHP domain-containing protein [Dissulfurispiraceae bacterium]